VKYVAMALALSSVTSTAWADERRPRNVITLQPLSLVTGYIDLEYERVFGRSISAYVAPGGIFGRTTYTDGSRSVGLYAASLDVGMRWFPWERAPSGAFGELGLGVYGSRFVAERREAGFGMRGTALIGYTFLIARHMAVSFGAGVQLARFAGTGNTYGALEVWPMLRVALGGAFLD
jgi:hypothetical protein